MVDTVIDVHDVQHVPNHIAQLFQSCQSHMVADATDAYEAARRMKSLHEKLRKKVRVVLFFHSNTSLLWHILLHRHLSGVFGAFMFFDPSNSYEPTFLLLASQNAAIVFATKSASCAERISSSPECGPRPPSGPLPILLGGRRQI